MVKFHKKICALRYIITLLTEDEMMLALADLEMRHANGVYRMFPKENGLEKRNQNTFTRKDILLANYLHHVSEIN